MMDVIMEYTPVSHNQCLCLKSKTSSVQCPHKPIAGSDFCGVHNRSKTKFLYSDFLAKSQNNTETIDNTISMSFKKMKCDKQEFYEPSDFISSREYTKFDLKTLKKTFEKYGIPIKLRKSKKDLFNILFCFFKSINECDISQLIKIQRWIRNMNLIRRIKCKNEDDFYTGEDKFETSLKSVYIIRDTSGLYYWFDVETFGNLCKTGGSEIKNPYSRNEIDKYYIERFNKKYNIMLFTTDDGDMNEEQKFRNRMLMIFQQFDMLDNYTDFNWFANLDIIMLKKMYAICEDIWNYRAQLTIESKKNIVYGGLAFTHHPSTINNWFDKKAIQNVMLYNFEKLITQGSTEDDKKLGAMLILTALVEVSPDAAFAMPQYIQVS